MDLLQHPNLYLASQAMQCLLHATDEEIFPWHDPPLPPDGRSVKQGPDALVWRRMYELTRWGGVVGRQQQRWEGRAPAPCGALLHPARPAQCWCSGPLATVMTCWRPCTCPPACRSLIPSLLKHQNPDTFPGSGLLALRLLAFTSSWLRYHFTPVRHGQAGRMGACTGHVPSRIKSICHLPARQAGL